MGVSGKPAEHAPPETSTDSSASNAETDSRATALDNSVAANEAADAIDDTEATMTVAAGVRPVRRARRPSMGGLQGGERLGRYIVVSQLGSGGMGVVYTAYDPELDRRVALKVVGRRAGDSQAQARMRREAQAMARLAHPNVVTVHDVGEVEGDLFIAMERVEGDTLRTWLREQKRDWRDIVAVFRQAGEGLAAAHGAGLIHRDFKPSNVLVDPQGKAQVLDFGIARLSAEADEPNATDTPEPAPGKDITDTGSGLFDTNSSVLSQTLTVAGTAVGTPRYMAPEQFAGESDERSDQFAFCVALYEALYRKHPFPDALRRPTGTSLSGPAKAPPSVGVPRAVAQVVMRGLSRDPEDRHESMPALLAALDRAARPRGRRIAVTLAVAGAIVGAALIARSESPPVCRGAAAAMAKTWNDGVRDRLRDAFGSVGRSYAKDLGARVDAKLEQYAAGWTAMRTEACEATRVRGEQSELLLDLRMHCLDRRRAELGAALSVLTPESGVPVIDESLDVVDGLTPLAGCADVERLRQAVPPPESPALAAAVEAIRRRLDLASSLRGAGRFEAGVAAAKEAVEDLDGVDYAPVQAEARHLLAVLEDASGRHEAAEAEFYRAATAAGEARDDALLASVWLDLLWNVGYRQQGRHAEGMAFARVAEAAAERAGAPPGLRAALSDRIGALLYAKGEYRAAIERYKEALQLEPDLREHNGVFSSTLNNLGEAHRHLGEYEAAVDYFQRALGQVEGRLGPDHPDVAITVNNLGIALQFSGDIDGARQQLERALAIREAALDPGHPKLGHTLLSLGSLEFSEKRYDRAELYTRRALSLWEKALGESHVYVGYALNNLADILRGRGECGESMPLTRRAIDIFEAGGGTESGLLVYPLAGDGECLLAGGDAAKALAVFERGLAIFETRGGEPVAAARLRFGAAQALTALGRAPARRRELAEKARADYAKTGDDEAVALVDKWLASNAAGAP